MHNTIVSTMLMKLQKKSKRKNKSNQDQPTLTLSPTPALPPAIWTDHIYGFLEGDRKSFNTISLLNTEIRDAMKNVTKPWPNEVQLFAPGKKDFIQEVQFSPDGRTLIGLTECNKRIHIWNIDTGFQATLKQEYASSSPQFSEDGKLMMSHRLSQICGVDVQQEISIWDTSNWSCINTLKHDDEEDRYWYWLRRVEFSPSGDIVAAFEHNGYTEEERVVLWYLNPTHGKKHILPIFGAGDYRPFHGKFSADENDFAVFMSKERGLLHDAASYKVKSFKRTAKDYISTPPQSLVQWSRVYDQGSDHFLTALSTYFETSGFYAVQHVDFVGVYLEDRDTSEFHQKRVYPPTNAYHPQFRSLIFKSQFSSDQRFLVAIEERTYAYSLPRRLHSASLSWLLGKKLSSALKLRLERNCPRVDSGAMYICDLKEEEGSGPDLTFQTIPREKTLQKRRYAYLDFDMSPNDRQIAVVDSYTRTPRIVSSSWFLRC